MKKASDFDLLCSPLRNQLLTVRHWGINEGVIPAETFGGDLLMDPTCRRDSTGRFGLTQVTGEKGKLFIPVCG
jgi:hypothetical protein